MGFFKNIFRKEPIYVEAVKRLIIMARGLMRNKFLLKGQERLFLRSIIKVKNILKENGFEDETKMLDIIRANIKNNNKITNSEIAKLEEIRSRL